VKLTHPDWLKIGETAGWLKTAQEGAFVSFTCINAAVGFNVTADELEMDPRCKVIALSNDPWNIKINKYLEVARDIASVKMGDISVRETLAAEGIWFDAVVPPISEGAYVKSVRMDWDGLTKRITGQEE